MSYENPGWCLTCALIQEDDSHYCSAEADEWPCECSGAHISYEDALKRENQSYRKVR